MLIIRFRALRSLPTNAHQSLCRTHVVEQLHPCINSTRSVADRQALRA